MAEWCFINNDFYRKDGAGLPIQDLAIQRGYGVFDYIRVLNGVPLFAEAHIARLLHSSGTLRIPVPFSSEQLMLLINELIKRNELQQSGIRITVTGGTSPDGFSITQPNLIIAEQPAAPVATGIMREGIRLVTYEHQRQLAHIKTIDYLVAIWLKPFIIESGADEVLYTSNGLISECPRANFFLLSADNTLATPHTGILEGITRKNIIDCAKALGVQVEERTVSAGEIASARGAFICSTTKELLPVASINGKQFNPGNSLFSALHEALSKRIEDYQQSQKQAVFS